MRSWLVPDLIAAFPFDHLASLIALGGAFDAPLSLRLFKLVKVLRLSILGKKIDRCVKPRRPIARRRPPCRHRAPTPSWPAATRRLPYPRASPTRSRRRLSRLSSSKMFRIGQFTVLLLLASHWWARVRYSRPQDTPTAAVLLECRV